VQKKAWRWREKRPNIAFKSFFSVSSCSTSRHTVVDKNINTSLTARTVGNAISDTLTCVIVPLPTAVRATTYPLFSREILTHNSPCGLRLPCSSSECLPVLPKLVIMAIVDVWTKPPRHTFLSRKKFTSSPKLNLKLLQHQLNFSRFIILI